MEDILIDAAPDDFRRDRVPWVFIVILCIPREVFARSERIILRLPVIGAFFFAASLTHTSHLSLTLCLSRTRSQISHRSQMSLSLSLVWALARGVAGLYNPLAGQPGPRVD